MLAIPSHVSFEEAAMVEPLACVLRGLHETGVKIGDTVAVIGAGPIGLMFVHVAQAMGCNVIAVIKRDGQIEAARRMFFFLIVTAPPEIYPFPPPRAFPT